MVDKLKLERSENLKKYSDTKNIILRLERRLDDNLIERFNIEGAIRNAELELKEYANKDYELNKKIRQAEGKGDF